MSVVEQIFSSVCYAPIFLFFIFAVLQPFLYPDLFGSQKVMPEYQMNFNLLKPSGFFIYHQV
jgi:hypothetical protein